MAMRRNVIDYLCNSSDMLHGTIELDLVKMVLYLFLPSTNCFDSSGGDIANDSMLASLISLISFSTSAFR